MAATSTRSALEFIWEGQDGLFELVSKPDQRRRYPKSEALASLDGMRYYGPLARKRNGSKKEDIADVGNVLWADVDSLEVDDRLSRLAIPPSLVVITGGKGFWIYFKLVSAIPTDLIETLNRGLAALLEGDNCHNRDRLARIPGSMHESGRQGGILEFTGLVYDPDELAFLASVETEQPPVSPAPEASDILVGGCPVARRT